MKLEIDIPEEMLESEILDAIISVDTDNKIIKKKYILSREQMIIKRFSIRCLSCDDFDVAESEG